MKKNFIILTLLFLSSFIYADSIQDLFNDASNSYAEKNIDKTIEILEKITNDLKMKKIKSNTDEIETVEFTRLKNFPSRYEGKKIKLLDTAISSKVGKKFNGDYRIEVSTLNQSSYFLDEPYEDGKLFFVISESLLEKLMDKVAAGYVGYFNVYTDKIYPYIEGKSYWDDKKTFYVAKIVSLECLSYRRNLGTTIATGEFLTE